MPILKHEREAKAAQKLSSILYKMKHPLTEAEYLEKHPEDIENVRKSDAARAEHEEMLYHAKLLQEALMEQKAEEDAIWDARADAEADRAILDGDEDYNEMLDDGGKHAKELQLRRNPKTVMKSLGYDVPYDFEIPDEWYSVKSPDAQKTQLIMMIKAFNRRKEEEYKNESTPI